ncbi:unnamed protein product [Acanthoscelides obtectus]|uniref:Uncharacterized protein n=1 Tax=Acanthoscelides obtectus TaxID=200917 RepID=A0A9P0LDE1_ACAOB|nr:unnamed protein product [Acanthoscelides obtectus]CAK1624118.1 hypothetical protein AOBTE_LOCUS2331 [Acanthoscelides obtectus]
MNYKLKIGKILPLYKKDDVHSMENYRPLTLCSSFSKLLEYGFMDRLLKLVEENKLINE